MLSAAFTERLLDGIARLDEKFIGSEVRRGFAETRLMPAEQRSDRHHSPTAFLQHQSFTMFLHPIAASVR